MITRVKRTRVCKGVLDYSIDKEMIHEYVPQSGDVALFEVLSLGKHTTVQSASRRNVHIIEGDHILAAFGSRYATGQFEGYVPAKPSIYNDVLAIGGVVGQLKSKNAAYEHIPATQVRLIGYALDEHRKVINTRYREVPRVPFSGRKPEGSSVILSVGSSMDSGKTTSAAYLCRGLKASGANVAYIKLTGTVYTKDQDLAYDLGADFTVDFSDAGYPSTYMCSHDELLDLYQTLLSMTASARPDHIVIEIADGLVQRETDFLLRSEKFMSTVDSVMLSCGDSLAAFYGVEYLDKLGYPPVVLSGLFTMSPLLVKEVQKGCSVPVLDIQELSSGQHAALFQKGKRLV
ncbi:MAG: hypothetical protein RL213_1566 [Bacteroidota bacterium]|jgi:hypothetical protein